jgi:hypothetical protein
MVVVLSLVGACAPPKPPTPPATPDAPSLAQVEPATPIPTPEVEAPTEPQPAAIEPVAIEPEALAAIAGAYRYRGGKASVRKSIDGVVDDMNVMVRGIARKRLIAANTVPKRIVIDQAGDEITVRIDGRAYVASLGGAAQRVKDPNGEVSRMRYELRDGALYQIFHTDQGDRTNVFTAREGGGLAMAVRIHSRQLPSDVRYRLSFAEAG